MYTFHFIYVRLIFLINLLFVLNFCPINEMQSKFVYPSDKSFDKRVLKHVAKHFKQYKHSLKRDYSNPKKKQKRRCMMSFPMATLVMDGYDWFIIGIQLNTRYLFSDKIWMKWAYMHSNCFKFSMYWKYLNYFTEFGWNRQGGTSFTNSLSYNGFN